MGVFNRIAASRMTKDDFATAFRRLGKGMSLPTYVGLTMAVTIPYGLNIPAIMALWYVGGKLGHMAGNKMHEVAVSRAGPNIPPTPAEGPEKRGPDDDEGPSTAPAPRSNAASMRAAARIPSPDEPVAKAPSSASEQRRKLESVVERMMERAREHASSKDSASTFRP